MGNHFNPVQGWVKVLPSIGAIALEARQPQLGLLSSGVGSTEPTASFQGEYLSEEPTCDHRSLVTLTLLRDLGGSDAADHGQYPSPWDLPPQEAGFSKIRLHLSMEKALLLTPHLFRADPGFPRPVAL